MTDRSVPDYPLDDVLALEGTEPVRALFDDTRLAIIELLSERAATTTELAESLDKPKGTVGHHLGVLADAGLVRVVRTEKVRALEAKYYGRTARTFDFTRAGMTEVGLEPESILAGAAREAAAAHDHFQGRALPTIMSARYARIPEERAGEFAQRVVDLLHEFVGAPRGGDVVFGLAIGLYPTNRPHLPDRSVD